MAFSVAIESAPLPPQFEAVLQQLIDAHRVRPGPLLELLQAIQAEFGWVPQQAIQPVAKALRSSVTSPSWSQIRSTASRVPWTS